MHRVSVRSTGGDHAGIATSKVEVASRRAAKCTTPNRIK